MRFCPSCGTATGLPAGPSPGPNSAGKRTDHIKYRNMWVRAALIIISFGIYLIYWYFASLEELHQANGKEPSGCLWTLLSLVPILNLFAYWHHSSEYTTFVNGKYPAIAISILWIVFSPAVWFLVQSDLNRAANRPA